mmetsp:Transcript_3564/g.9537  ORF Transcript_3564/g.9537 Transcript_3564/m.9537 type:complete len:226 (-) Transcript_3564:1068-1745(-)
MPVGVEQRGSLARRRGGRDVPRGPPTRRRELPKLEPNPARVAQRLRAERAVAPQRRLGRAAVGANLAGARSGQPAVIRVCVTMDLRLLQGDDHRGNRGGHLRRGNGVRLLCLRVHTGRRVLRRPGVELLQRGHLLHPLRHVFVPLEQRLHLHQVGRVRIGGGGERVHGHDLRMQQVRVGRVRRGVVGLHLFVVGVGLSLLRRAVIGRVVGGGGGSDCRVETKGDP